MAAVEQTPGPGHNQPPHPLAALRAELEEDADNRVLMKRRDDLLGSVERMPAAIESDEAAGQVADLIRMLRACAKAADDARDARKRPLLEQGRTIDSFFRAIIDPLKAARAKVQAKLDAYHRTKAEAERAAAAAEAKPIEKTQIRGDFGAVATTSRRMTFVIDDLDKIPLDTLRPYFDRAAIEKAIRAFIRAGGKELAGVRIFPDETLQVR